MTEPKLVPDLFFDRVEKSPNDTAVMCKEGGQWRSASWKDLEQKVRGLARAVADWVDPKEIVCLLSENRPEWWIADMAVLSLAGVTAPIYPTNPPKDIAYILNDCEAKLLFASSREQLDKVRQLRAENKVPHLQ